MNILSKYRAAVIASLIAVAALFPAANAQSPGQMVKLNVPFAFDCGRQHFAPGTYTINMQSSRFALLHGTSHSGLTMAWLEEANRPSKTNKAVFRNHGGTYFLEEVWNEGYSSHVFFLHPKIKEQTKLASNVVPSVELALLETPRP